MHTISRPLGRFFVVLVVLLAWMSPRAVAAGGVAIRPPEASSAWGMNQWSVVGGEWPANQALGAALPRPHAYFDSINLTKITDTVYRADGSKAQGKLLISWPAFTTAAQNVIAAGSLSVTLGPDGLFSASLAPTTGSSPTGVYYRVIYQLDDGSNKEEYWAVPATDNTTISAVRAKLVPTTVAAQFITRDLADTVYVHVNDDQTVGGVKTFSKSPAVPDPNNPTDVANKEYVDANGGAGSVNLDSPPPIGDKTPNTVIGSSLAASAGAGGDADFNAVKLWTQTSGEVDLDFVKQDGSLKSRGAYYLPWFQQPNMGAGILNFTMPLFTYEMVGGMTVLGRYNSYPLSDPGVGTCTVTHTGAGGSGATYTLRFVSSNSDYSLASPACSDPQGYSYDNHELDASHTNVITYHQPGGYANMLPSRGTNPVGSVVKDPNAAVAGVLSTVTSCGAKNGCTWTDDGSWGNTTLASLAGAFFNDPDRNTTASMIITGRQFLQGGQNLSGGAIVNGRMTGGYLNDPPAPTVVANTQGTTSYSYSVVYHDYGLGITNVSPPTTINNGAAVPNNSIKVSCYPSYSSWDLLKNGTTQALATDLPCEGSFDGATRQPYVFTDSGQSTTAYSAPTRNSTGDWTAHGAITGGADGSTSVFYGPLWGSNVTAIAPPYNMGYVQLLPGDTSHTGYIAWFDHSGNRTFELGYDTDSNLTLGADRGGSFNVGAPIITSGVTAQSMTTAGMEITGDLTARDIPGHEYFVSKYGGVQAAIDAAYNNGSVLGGAIVIDDRTSPYTGPGWIVQDSVTLKLAATTYTINGTVQYNNGVKNVVAGIILMPGSHMVGVGTSANHGTNVNAANGLNADLIATSTVGTGTGASAQWWHWGSLENLHMNGNKANQTAGNCINLENMGETAVLRAIEAGNCFADDIVLEGNFATQSEISNITVNSAGKFGIDLDNFQGVGVLRGLSGDSNATSIIRFNGNQSATLTILGMKSEEEISGHDPLITVDMLNDGSQPALYLVGGYTYARAGVQDVIKIINGKAGAAPFIQVSNFYVDPNFVNGVNDTVNGRAFAAANMNKVPFSYLPTGAYLSGQAFTFAPGTYIQAGLSALTEVFGSDTDGSTMIAAQGNGDGTSYFTGGLKFGVPNRTQYGSTPEMMARMGSRFLGAGQGYDTNTWVFVPIWKSGDASARWIGDPNQRWPEVYAADLNSTTATVGTLNVTNCNGCTATAAVHLISGTMVGPQSGIVGNGGDQNVFSVTIPAGTVSTGTGFKCYARWAKSSASNAVTYKWMLGMSTLVTQAVGASASANWLTELEVFTPSSLASEVATAGAVIAGTSVQAGPQVGLTASEDMANADTLKFTFNATSGETITPKTFYCTTIE